MKNKNYSIEFWRILFTYLVILLHFEGMITSERRYFICCYLGVEFFFILSGFFLMRHCMNDSEKSATCASAKYIALRFKQLYPAFLFSCALALCRLVVYHKSLGTILGIIKTHVWDLSLLWMLIPNNEYFTLFSWYISAMILASYFIYWLLKTKRDFFIGFVAPLSIVLIYSYFARFKRGIDFHITTYTPFVTDGILRAFAGLSFGCIAFSVQQKLQLVRQTRASKIGFTFCELIVLCLLYKILIGRHHGNSDFVAIPLFAALIVLEFSRLTFFSDLLNRKVFGFLGKATLGAYLNQGVCFVILAKLNVMRLSFFKANCAALILCTAVGFLSHYAVQVFWFLFYKGKAIFQSRRIGNTRPTA
ncbi:MAG: acyltransferase [Treponema sp.]|nr:acyltransferase [Treponema sp.]